MDDKELREYLEAIIGNKSIFSFVKSAKNIRYKEASFTIGTALKSQKQTINLDRDIERIIGVQLVCNIEKQLYDRGNIRLDLDNKELFPDAFPAKFLTAGFSCPVHERFYIVDREVGSGVLEFSYADVAHPTTVFASNTVKLFLMVEYKEGKA